jgi:hypothetical protein
MLYLMVSYLMSRNMAIMMWLCHLGTRIVMMHSRWLTCVRMVELLVVRSVLTLEIGAFVLQFACERGHRSFGEVAQDLVHVGLHRQVTLFLLLHEGVKSSSNPIHLSGCGKLTLVSNIVHVHHHVCFYGFGSSMLSPIRSTKDVYRLLKCGIGLGILLKN